MIGLNKTIISLALVGYGMIIATEARSCELSICHPISNVPSLNNYINALSEHSYGLILPKNFMTLKLNLCYSV